jgi:hypothetical protein
MMAKRCQLTRCAVAWALLCNTLALLKFTCASCFCSSNSSIVVWQVQSWHSESMQCFWHCFWSMESVLCSDSKIIMRSRTLSSIIFNLCRSTKLIWKSRRGDSLTSSFCTCARITRSDYIKISAAATCPVHGYEPAPSWLSPGYECIVANCCVAARLISNANRMDVVLYY